MLLSWHVVWAWEVVKSDVISYILLSEGAGMLKNMAAFIELHKL